MTSTTQDWGQGATLDVSGTTRVPFTRLVSVELRKMGDTRAGRWLLIAIGIITLLVIALVMIFADQDEKTFVNLVQVTGTPQGFLLPVLGVLLVTSEWSQRSALTTFTLEPNRARILGAKVAAAVVFGLAAVAVAVLLAVVATMLGGASDPWSGFGANDLVTFGLLQTLSILEGLAFGMLLLNSAAAIVLYYVIPIAFTIVISIISSVGGGDPEQTTAFEVWPWIDLNRASSAFSPDATVSGQEWAQLATSATIWVLLPLVLGWIRMTRAEVK